MIHEWLFAEGTYGRPSPRCVLLSERIVCGLIIPRGLFMSGLQGTCW